MKNIFVLFLITLAGGALCAHEWFAALTDTKPVKEGDMVTVGIYSTHRLIVPEGVQDASRNAVYILQNNKPADMRAKMNRNEAQKLLTAEFALPAGDPVMVVVNSIGSFTHTTSAGCRGGSKDTLKALGFSVLKTTARESWCKVYVNPSSSDQSFAQPLGLPLELVPVTNPADITTGKQAVFKVLLNGKPLANANINASYKSFNPKDEDAWALRDLKTDKAGQVTLDIPAAPAAKDIWVVKTSYTGDVKTPVYDAVAYNCWVSFVIR
ncbi:MAG: DUF4198 domain-containing protein [Spirochaetaceae bacterium]|jgi:uncharacterized GH25 family protein|nr:DUF4198 domain-containing protein [Spirochaetaceae bacterium]